MTIGIARIIKSPRKGKGTIKSQIGIHYNSSCDSSNPFSQVTLIGLQIVSTYLYPYSQITPVI